ncbi:fibronectin type III domain-containing protein [Cellulosilyticum ruminicola]|uniref:fibronectin type III domain-containing protein n=1 Tax=Cellulosilyticum ruminicola TaxID=425254 RepID=UPI0006D2B0EE|nr:fibronectin type III domain-containing protein [Cellulosilyticum ruminicola]
MKIKKRIAGMLAFAMLMSSTSVLGNPQERLPSDGIEPIKIEHYAYAEKDDINPKVQITFSAAKNIMPDNSVPANINNKKEAEYYSFLLEDINGESFESDRFRATAGKEKYVELIEEHLTGTQEIKNGNLYKVKVKPGHLHQDAQGRESEAELSSIINSEPSKYFLTDFNTIMREKDDQIEVVWEYIPGATYKLVYIDKDVNTKDGVDGRDGSEQAGVGTQTVVIKDEETKVVTEGGVKKVKYIIPNTIPGEKYSAYVLATGISNKFLRDGWEKVGKNIDTPKIAQVSRSVNLKIFNIGKKRVELQWQLGAWADNNTLETTKIYRKLEGESSYRLVGTLNNNMLNPRDPRRFEHDEPNKNCTYYVEFVFKGGEVICTKERSYLPYELREQPLKPQVPAPYSDKLRDQEGFEKSDYLVTGDEVSADKMKANTFYMKYKNPFVIQLVWDAPKKADRTIEHEMKYDIWVAEEEAMLSDTTITPIVKDLSISKYSDDELIFKQDKKTIIGFKTELKDYITNDGQVKPIISNKTYYIKIVAKRDYSGTESVSQPTIVAITVDKNGDIFTPPILAKPPLRTQENGVDTESITIEWLEKWYEIIANYPENYTDEEEYFFARLWNSRVFTGGTPAIKFKGENNLKEHILKTKNDVEAVKNIVGNDYSKNYRDREVTLGNDIQYEIKTLSYDEIIKKIKDQNTAVTTASAISLEKWIVQNESTTVDGWTTIKPGNVNHSDQLPWKDFKVTGLKPNTRYVILIRAYRVLDSGQKLTQTYPSYIIGTTNTEFESPQAKPTVPVLNANGVTDDSVSVWWTYNKDFDYELVYSRVEDTNTAKVWPFEISDKPGDKEYVANGEKAVITITGLMPDTTYHVWIRAKQKEGNEVSSWSNPVSQKTLTIENPDPPRGLGKADYQSILALGQEFLPVTNEWITVDWLRDVEDLEGVEAENHNLNKVYSYVVEFADNVEFLDSITVNTTEPGEKGKYEIIDKTMIKFTELQANRPYYVRAKTILTFTDPETGRVIVRESMFTKYVRLMTKTSEGEFDGGENDNVVVYPEPIVQSYKNDIWTWEIVDTNKIITQIQAKKDYYYTVDIELYKNKTDAKVRTIKMAKSVLDTLINQGMALKIETKVGEYEIPAKTLEYYSKKHSAKDKVQFDLTTANNADMYTYQRSYPDMMVKGERLEIRFRGDKFTSTVNKLDGYAMVKLKLDTVESYRYEDLYTYTYYYDSARWVKTNHTIETLNNTYLKYQTSQLGLFGLYQKNIASSGNVSYTMGKLINAYNINGLGTLYFSKDYVYRDQYVALLMGIAQNKSKIDLTVKPSTETFNKAKSTGIYSGNSNTTITEEQAVAGLIKLYELKTGYKIKPSNASFSNVSANYREAVKKAYAAGLITDINPKAKVTYSKLCDMLTQVIE